MKEASWEGVVRVLLLLTAAFSTLAIGFILFFLLREGYPIFTSVGLWGFIFGDSWNPTGEPPSYGILPILVGSLLVTMGAMLFAVPLGVGCAVYISQIARPRVKAVVKPAVEILAGIPSIVYGFFGLIVLSDWIRVLFDKPTGTTWFAGSVLLGVMALPTIVSVAEDALSSVLKEYREGSLALGATEWQTIRLVVMPSAISGITAAVILGMGRAIGETMAVMMVTGNAAIIPSPITDVFSPVRTITGTLGIEMGEVAVGSMHYHALFGLALVLLLITLIVNSLAILSFGGLKTGGTVACKTRSSCNKQANRRLSVVMAFAAVFLIILLLGVQNTTLLILAAFLSHHVARRMGAITGEKVAFSLITASTVVVLAILGVILYYILFNGLGALSWEFLTQPPRNLGRAGGIFPAIVGTMYLVAGALALALPLGVGAAIYLTEYNRENLATKVIKTGADLLNSTPSIVFGLFGFAFMVIYLRLGVSLIVGQMTLALMILPTIIRTTEEALKSVPYSLREGSLALGATKWQTIRRAVLPPAMPGIITGAILGVGRAAGETAPIMFTAVVFSQRFLPSSIHDPVMALPYHLFILSTNVAGSDQNKYGTALVLLLLVLSIYMVAILIRKHYRKNVR